MRLVIDTNRLFAAMMKDSVSRRILLEPRMEFFAPEAMFVETDRYRELICHRSGLTEAGLETLILLFRERITIVSADDYIHKYGPASALMEGTDPDDTPFLALGIALSLDGIWTEDRHFRAQDILPVLSTASLMKKLAYDRR